MSLRDDQIRLYYDGELFTGGSVLEQLTRLMQGSTLRNDENLYEKAVIKRQNVPLATSEGGLKRNVWSHHRDLCVWTVEQFIVVLPACYKTICCKVIKTTSLHSKRVV